MLDLEMYFREKKLTELKPVAFFEINYKKFARKRRLTVHYRKTNITELKPVAFFCKTTLYDQSYIYLLHFP